MEEIKGLLFKANKSIKAADHLAYVTYPLIRDTKLLNQIVQNIYLALLSSIDALLYYDWMFKRIPSFPQDLESKIDMFKNKTAKFHSLDKSHIALIYAMVELANSLKNKQFAFVKKDKLTLYDGINVKTVTFV